MQITKHSLFGNIDFRAIAKDPDFKEDSVREVIILPILKELGYEQQNIVRNKRLKHPVLTTGSTKRKISLEPDYLLKVEEKFAWVLDAKAPNKQVNNRSHVEQVYSYASHHEIRSTYFALCNGREFVLYSMEGIDDTPILHFALDEIELYWERLEKLLHKDKFSNKGTEKGQSLFTLTLPKVKSRIYNFLINDQIRETGAWGIKQMNVLQNIFKRNYEDLEKQEGGILHTYLSLRGLLRYEDSLTEFRQKAYSISAQKYFIERQVPSGGFGRIERCAQRKVKINPSLRHTAIAVSALIDLGGPSDAIYKGILYITRHWSTEDIKGDTSAALAIASTIHAINKFLFSNFQRKFPAKDSLSGWKSVCNDLLIELENQSSRSEFSPLWPPYGKMEIFTYTTALLTIDLLTTQIDSLDNSLSQIIAGILYSILGKMKDDGGIPYNSDKEESDFGTTLYVYAILSNTVVMNSINSIEDKIIKEKCNNAKPKLENYIINNFEHFEKSTYTHGETLVPIFFVDNV